MQNCEKLLRALVVGFYFLCFWSKNSVFRKDSSQFVCVFSILSLSHFKQNLWERKESGHSNHVWEESKTKAQQTDHRLFILYAAGQVLHLYKRDSEVQCVLSSSYSLHSTWLCCWGKHKLFLLTLTRSSLLYENKRTQKNIFSLVLLRTHPKKVGPVFKT